MTDASEEKARLRVPDLAKRKAEAKKVVMASVYEYSTAFSVR